VMPWFVLLVRYKEEVLKSKPSLLDQGSQNMVIDG
jgi:hypothetical protein